MWLAGRHEVWTHLYHRHVLTVLIHCKKKNWGIHSPTSRWFELYWSDVHATHTWTLPCTKANEGNSLRVREGWHGREKEEEEYCHIPVLGEGQRVRKMTKEFPAALFLLFDRFFLPFFLLFWNFILFCQSPYISLSHFGSALFTRDVRESGSFPFWIWQWEETLVPSQALIFCVDWALIIYDSKLCNTLLLCLHPCLSLCFSFSHFLYFLEDFPLVPFSFSPLSLSGGLLQLFENRLLCCCWVLESEQDPGLTCGREGEPV